MVANTEKEDIFSEYEKILQNTVYNGVNFRKSFSMKESGHPSTPPVSIVVRPSETRSLSKGGDSKSEKQVESSF